MYHAAAAERHTNNTETKKQTDNETSTSFETYEYSAPWDW
jgi:hypothetical protein